MRPKLQGELEFRKRFQSGDKIQVIGADTVFTNRIGLVVEYYECPTTGHWIHVDFGEKDFDKVPMREDEISHLKRGRHDKTRTARRQ